MGHWVVYYTSPKNFMITYFYSLAEHVWLLLLNFDWLVYLVKFPNVSITNCNLKKG